MIEIKNYQDLTKDELFEILKLRTDIFVVEQNCPYPEIDFHDKEAFHLILKVKNELIGTLRIIDGKQSNYCKIGRVAIHKNHRKNSYGKDIMIAAINFVRNRLQKEQIVISAQQYLDKFYTELGFKSTGKKYLEDGIPHQEMTFDF